MLCKSVRCADIWNNSKVISRFDCLWLVQQAGQLCQPLWCPGHRRAVLPGSTHHLDEVAKAHGTIVQSARHFCQRASFVGVPPLQPMPNHSFFTMTLEFRRSTCLTISRYRCNDSLSTHFCQSMTKNWQSGDLSCCSLLCSRCIEPLAARHASNTRSELKSLGWVRRAPR